MKDYMNKLTFELSVDQINIILAALTKAPLPSEVTNPLVQYIQEEGSKQLKPTNQPDTPVVTSEVEG